MALAQKNIIKTRANYRIPTIMQGCGFSKPQLKRVHQEIFLFKNPKQLAGFLPQSAGFLLSRQVSLLGEGRISLLPVPLPDPHPAPSWGDLNEVAEAECTVSPPTPPSWAEMVRRGMNPGQSGSTPPPPPTPAVQHHSPHLTSS